MTIEDDAPTAPHRRSAPPPTPSSDEPVEIALDAERDDPSMDSGARVLLAKQAKLVDADIGLRRQQTLSERTSLVLKVLTAVVGVAFAAVLISIAFTAARSRAVVVEAFDSPPALAERGLSGRVVAAAVQDGLTNIQNTVRTTAQRRNISNAWTGDIAVQVATTGVSIGEIDRILRRRLGHETYIGGDLVQNEDGTLSLTVRGTGTPPRTFTGPSSELTRLTTEAAEYVYGLSEPRLFTVYLLQRRRYADGDAFSRAALSRASEETRPELLVYWGLHTLAVDRSDVERGRRGLGLLNLGLGEDPYVWRGWNSLISTVGRLDGEEAASAVGRRAEALAAEAPEGREAPPTTWVNYQILVEDWTGQIRNVELDARQTGGGGSFSVQSTSFLAEAEARRYDWGRSASLLQLAAPEDADAEATRLFIDGFRALHERRYADAIVPLEVLHARWEESQDLQFQLIRAPCYLAAAYGLSGRAVEAAALFGRVRRRVVCYALEGDVAEATGDRAAADRVWARATALAPSLPTAFEHWGRALLARGDLDGAARAFDRAHRNGPNWADPIKGQGDVLARRGRWREAVTRYDAALRLAPRWPELLAARRQAQAQAGGS